MSVTFYTADEDLTGPDVNMANGNAVAVLDLLGLRTDAEDWDLTGILDAEDFIGRVLVATAMLDVATDDEHGTPTYEIRGDRGATWVECGRRPGYLAERLGQLHEVGLHARTVGARVAWA